MNAVIDKVRQLCDEILATPDLSADVRSRIERIKALLQWEG